MTFYSRPIIEAIEAIARCGFDCAEIWTDHAWDDNRGATTEQIRAALNRTGIQATVHCPVMDINITSPNRGIREESIAQTLRAVELARDINARLIVVHPGRRFSLNEPVDLHWTLLVNSVSRILNHARENGVIAALENMECDKEVVSVRFAGDVKRLLADCGVPNGHVTLDTAHMRSTQPILDFIRDVAGQIAHVHLSDANAERLHLRIGDGAIDLTQVAHSLSSHGFSGVCSLECFIPNSEEMLHDELVTARNLFK